MSLHELSYNNTGLSGGLSRCPSGLTKYIAQLIRTNVAVALLIQQLVSIKASNAIPLISKGNVIPFENETIINYKRRQGQLWSNAPTTGPNEINKFLRTAITIKAFFMSLWHYSNS